MMMMMVYVTHMQWVLNSVLDKVSCTKYQVVSAVNTYNSLLVLVSSWELLIIPVLAFNLRHLKSRIDTGYEFWRLFSSIWQEYIFCVSTLSYTHRQDYFQYVIPLFSRLSVFSLCLLSQNKFLIFLK